MERNLFLYSNESFLSGELIGNRRGMAEGWKEGELCVLSLGDEVRDACHDSDDGKKEYDPSDNPVYKPN